MDDALDVANVLHQHTITFHSTIVLSVAVILLHYASSNNLPTGSMDNRFANEQEERDRTILCFPKYTQITTD